MKRSNDTGYLLGIDFTENPEQRELIRLMNQNNLPVVFCFGNAGTGKTFTALAASVDLVKIRKKYRKVFYIQNHLRLEDLLDSFQVELTKNMGFISMA